MRERILLAINEHGAARGVAGESLSFFRTPFALRYRSARAERGSEDDLDTSVQPFDTSAQTEIGCAPEKPTPSDPTPTAEAFTSFSDDATSADISALLQPLLKGSAAVDVVLDDRLVRYFVLSPPAGTASLAELRAVAELRLADLFGAAPGTYTLACDWRMRGSFLCCALPRRIMDALADAAQKARAVLVSTAPLFVRIANSQHRLHHHVGWTAVRAGGWATAAYLERGTGRIVRSAALASSSTFEPWLARLALTAGLPLANPIVLDADQPDAASDGAVMLDAERRDVQLLDALRQASAA